MDMYVGNGMRATVKAIGSFDLNLRNGLIIVLINCDFVATMTRGVVSLSYLVDNEFIHSFTNYEIYVFKDDVIYLNEIPRDGIYEIDMHDLVPNVSSIIMLAKKSKRNLDSTYLCNYRLGHINKKFIEKLQHDGLLKPTDDNDDETSHEEDIHEMSFKTYSNPLFDLDEEIISSEFNPIHNEDLDSTLKNDRFDIDSYLLESSLNHDALMISSLKIDSLLAEFAGELIFLESIPPRIDEANCYPEEDIHLDDDDDSERDIIIHEELLDNYSLSFPVNESFYFDIPSFSRPPAKPPDGNTGIVNIKMMGDISDQKVPMPRLMIIRVSNQEKSVRTRKFR
nr:hypothetical protein [Tanacetum cinerariifolium]